MKSKDILKELFETSYNEYKEYEVFLNEQVKEIQKGRETFAKFAIENKSDMDKVVEKMFEVNEKPAMYKNDLLKLQNKLINVYDTVKDIIEIPKEVREEINTLPKQRLSYKVKDGKAIEINKDMNDEIRKYAKEQNMAFVKDIIERQTNKK